MEPIKFTIDIPPITKKNHQQIVVNRQTGRPFVVPSKQYKQYERDAGYFLKGRGLNISEPVNLQAKFYVDTRRRVDLCNLLQSLCDILTCYEIVQDDFNRIIVSFDGSRVFYDKERPRTEVEITPASPEDVEEVRKFEVKK